MYLTLNRPEKNATFKWIISFEFLFLCTAHSQRDSHKFTLHWLLPFWYITLCENEKEWNAIERNIWMLIKLWLSKMKWRKNNWWNRKYFMRVMMMLAIFICLSLANHHHHHRPLNPKILWLLNAQWWRRHFKLITCHLLSKQTERVAPCYTHNIAVRVYFWELFFYHAC